MTGPRRPEVAALVTRLREAGYVVPGAAPKIEWFGDSRELNRELVDLVRRGVKRASAGLLAAWQADGDPLPRVGDVEIIIDWDGEPMAVVEVTDVRIQGFDDVDEAFARAARHGAVADDADRLPPLPAAVAYFPYCRARYSPMTFASASLTGAPKTLIILVTTPSHCFWSPRGCMTM